MLMANFKKIVEVLNDLIKINKDREEGYVKASRELTPAEHNLRGVFERKAQDSRNNVQQLQYKAEEIAAGSDEKVADDDSISGMLYRVWMDIKNAFTDDEEKSVLKSCVHGEEAAQKCYADAINEKELPEDITELLKQQKRSIDDSTNEIKALLNK